MYNLANTLSRLQNASKQRISAVSFSFQRIPQEITTKGDGCKLPQRENKKNSFFFVEVLQLLQREGFIRFFTYKQEKRCVYVTVHLKYNSKGIPAMRQISTISTSGRTVHAGTNSLWQPLTTQGILVLSTPHGLKTDQEARFTSLGGQLLFSICLF